MRLPCLASPHPWLLSFLFWVGYLFSLSSNPESVTEGAPAIPHIDKILHFGYFMGGAGLFSTWLLLAKGRNLRPSVRILLPIALFAIIAALDELQQSFSPGRSGNDPFDWLADTLGATTGVLLGNRFHPLLTKISSRPPQN